MQLYLRIFPSIAECEEFRFYAWEDVDVRAFLGDIDHFHGLRRMEIRNDFGGCRSKVSQDVQAELAAALEARGGRLKVRLEVVQEERFLMRRVLLAAQCEEVDPNTHKV